MAQDENFLNPGFLTVSEVADVMRVSKMTVYRLVHSGELPAVRFGRSYRIPESAVALLVQSALAEGAADRRAAGSADTA
ncbi:helix-turn-helix domain-containing protein [Arthrobacter sp. H14-L1]|uniref:helix-turn-helix domain-containing protein n=1 Tax=Arthrobacter sp. H14-L1 TaxID=2996697 RepID=UPI00226DD590|nr:helix-turn-helix domain-containing protein [Arthrobacter sp. H14-L1]MCY0904000.1 helix-turn-helix domain-containing protein [Arthrobacter sp. H14-L1]